MEKAGGRKQPEPRLDTELVLLYKGEPARLMQRDIDILVMKYMNWSRSDLDDAPDDDILRIRQHMRAESEVAKMENRKAQQSSGGRKF